MSAPPVEAARRLVCDADGVRVDRFVAAQAGGASRRDVAAIIAAGAVRVNGRTARKGDVLRTGDVVEIAATAPAAAALLAQPELDLTVLYEDDALLAVDKPSGMPSVARHPTDRGCIANFLVARSPDQARVGRTPLESGLVHRLDTGTSGVLLAARTADAWQQVRDQFRHRGVDKRYVALVAGAVDAPLTLRLPIAHHPRRAGAMLVCAEPRRARELAARPAHSDVRPLARRAGATLVEVIITTGVRHQIRAHLAAAGHPVCGDPLYGGPPADRLMLHAARLALRHPFTGATVSIESPLPAVFGRR